VEDFSPTSFTILELFHPAVLAFLGATAVALIGAIFFRDGRTFFSEFRRVLGYYFLAGVPIALVGYSMGFLTGISRSPAIGSLLPAVLAAIGGLSVYVFGSDVTYKAVVGYCVSLLVVSLFYGTQSGSFEREVHREDRLIAVFELERRLRNYRVHRGLPEKSADWLYLGESTSK
jgi:Na+/H+ antiporter NhaD/arsenite permease-like protein